jgi:hypothetical protein
MTGRLLRLLARFAPVRMSPCFLDKAHARNRIENETRPIILTFLTHIFAADSAVSDGFYYRGHNNPLGAR